MPGVCCGRTNIARIWAIVFPNIKTCSFKEVFYFISIRQAPLTSKAGRVTKKSPSGFSSFSVYHIVFIAYAPAAKQRIAPYQYAFTMCISGESLPPVNVFGRTIFHIQMAAETKNE